MPYKNGTDIKCKAGSKISFTGKVVVLTRDWKSGENKGEKRISLNAIASLSVSSGNLFMNPNLTIELNNEEAPKDKLKNPNCVFFSKSQIAEIKDLVEAIEEAM